MVLSAALVLFSGRALGRDARADRKVCGRNGLGLVLAHLGAPTDFARLDSLLPNDRAPFSFAEVEEAARTAGRRTHLVRWKRPGEADFRGPSILHLRMGKSSTEADHFLACFGETSEGLCVAEFPNKPFFLPRHRLEQIWDGDVLYIDNGDGATIDRLILERNVRRLTLGLCVVVTLLVIARSLRRVYRARVVPQAASPAR